MSKHASLLVYIRKKYSLEVLSSKKKKKKKKFWRLSMKIILNGAWQNILRNQNLKLWRD